MRLLLAVGLSLTGLVNAADIETQREVFRIAYPAAERGQWLDDSRINELTTYPLYPDLLGAYLRATVSEQPNDVLAAFLQRYPDHPESRLLLRARLRALAKSNRWSEFVALADKHPSAVAGTELRCAHATGLFEVGRTMVATERGLQLWTVGISQPKACDPVFHRMKADGTIGEPEHRTRLDLALEQRQFRLAAYLSRTLGDAERARVRDWQAMANNPAVALSLASGSEKSDGRMLRSGLLQLAYRDTDRAVAEYRRLAPTQGLSPNLEGELLRRGALGSARRHDADAQQRLSEIPEFAVDKTVRQWKLRAALRRQDLKTAVEVIEAMPANEATESNHRYWLGRGLLANGRNEEGEQLLAALADERHLYGFLAADRLDLPYAFGHTETQADLGIQHRLAEDPGFVRARELFLVGLYGRGRQLWEGLVADLPPAEQQQAALLAKHWGWHSRAIATATRAGLRHDLDLRFPIPTEPWWRQLDLSLPLVVGLTRSESLFMPDVRSSAGAVGLMQLMPATGREVAKSLKVSYRGLRTLTDPAINARLGTEYLKRMLKRFDEHKLLAAAAYNAGPHRVERWLPTRRLPADIWLETIPFAETRGYVQRVLEAHTIIQWRLGNNNRRLSAELPPVQPAVAEQTARNARSTQPST